MSANDDRGFTMTEVVVSISLIVITMTALMSFCVATIGALRRQTGTQTAVQLAADGVEAARALPVATLLAHPPGDPTPAVRNGVPYTRTWSVAVCYRPAVNGSCVTSPATGTPFVRVVVTVTWPEVQCAASTCQYSTSTLISKVDTDPAFTAS